MYVTGPEPVTRGLLVADVAHLDPPLVPLITVATQVQTSIGVIVNDLL